MVLRYLIQNKLVSTVRDSEDLQTVTYDRLNLASAHPALGSAVVASCHANETSSSFGIDSSFGRDRRQRRLDWTFELKVKFNQEVSVEALEEAWLENPPVLTREDTSSKQVTLLLISSDISHPPQQSSSTGTSVTFIVQALLSRN